MLRVLNVIRIFLLVKFAVFIVWGLIGFLGATVAGFNFLIGNDEYLGTFFRFVLVAIGFGIGAWGLISLENVVVEKIRKIEWLKREKAHEETMREARRIIENQKKHRQK